MEPKIIALMGATGSGKSSMIKLITGDESIPIGHGLESGTQSIASYTFSFMAYNITIVDTPGFDDTYRSDSEILRSIVEWLAKSYSEGTKLSGIIYLHRITDVRMQGSALRNLRVFQELCGKDCFNRVALCPTFWDVSTDEDSVLEKRLLELKSTEGFWGRMIDNGSKVFHEPLNRNQAMTMVYQLVTKEAVALQVQREVVDEHKPFTETSALLSLKLEEQRQEHEAMMDETRRQFKEDLQRRARTHSEDLAGLRKMFEEKLAMVEQTNQKLKAEIQAKTNAPLKAGIQANGNVPLQTGIQANSNVPPKAGVQANSNVPVVSSTSVRRKPVQQVQQQPLPPSSQQQQQQLHRATTTAADGKSIAEEIRRRRHQAYLSFYQYVTTTVQQLEFGGKQSGIACTVVRQKSCYTMVCVNCLRNIGGGNCYSCSLEYDFVFCADCFENQNVSCDDNRHNKQDMIRGRLNTTGTRCPRVLTPIHSAPLPCRKCGENVGRCFLHCCECSEAFDMCVNCAVRGKHCPGHRKGIPNSRHKVEICARYVAV